MRTSFCSLSICGLMLLLAGGAVLTAAPDLGNDQQRDEGQQLYDKYCAQCHGLTGDGRGYATPRLKPEPRDFTSGKYKFRTTPSGTLPTDADVVKVIREGLPYTSMPGWPRDKFPSFTDAQVQNIVYYLKSFSEDFQNPDKLADPIAIPRPPALTDESIEHGRQVFELQGCAACHGQLGRGDGLSAPTLKDDWGNHIRAADMTMRWTFRGGPTRQDIYRTFSTGVNGTPMPSYYDSLQETDRWDLVNYVYSLGDDDEPNYANLLQVAYVDDEIDVADGDTLFESAPTSLFPLVGQIIEPGRNFYPSASSIRVQAVYNRREIAFRLRWNDMRAETSGSNSPLLEVPPWDEDNPQAAGGAGDEEGEGDFWGDEAEGEDEGDFWGDEAEGEDEGDFWGEEDEGGAADGGFSDAVALQLPSTLSQGIAKPYFIFGDLERPVDLWFVDLARGESAQQYVGRGAASLTPVESDEIEVVSSFDQGEWTVVLKRPMRSTGNISFDQDQYVPLAMSVWDGFNRERGNKRALSAWFYLYVRPAEEVSAVGPMLKTAGGVLAVEIIIILLLRLRFGRRRETRANAVLAGQT